MGKINSYKLDSQLIITKITVPDSASSDGKSTVILKDDAVIDESKVEAHSNSSYETSDPNNNFTKDTAESYFYDGYAYGVDYGSPNISSNAFGVWSKSLLTDIAWTYEDKYRQQIYLLKKATHAVPKGNEKVNGIDCYVLDVTLPKTESVKWVETQTPDYSEISTVPELNTRDLYLKTYKSMTFKVWINQYDYRIMKTDIDVVFEATPEDINGAWWYKDPATRIMKKYDAAMTFFVFNQPVTIQPPQEALEAQLK